MPEEKRVFTPNRTYDVQVKIKNLDYTNDMIRIGIGSSLSTAYQVVTLVMSVDPNDVIIEDVFGGEPIKLGITLHREQIYPGPRIDIELNGNKHILKGRYCQCLRIDIGYGG